MAMPDRHILVLEDERLAGLGLAAMLETAGFAICGPATTADEAAALLDAQPCDLAILDIQLGPHETSAPIARRLRREGIPFLVISGHLGAERASAFSGAPAFAKPIGSRTIITAVQEALGAMA